MTSIESISLLSRDKKIARLKKSSSTMVVYSEFVTIVRSKLSSAGCIVYHPRIVYAGRADGVLAKESVVWRDAI